MKGLLNYGNTCYFNSILQCLLQIPNLSNYFIMKHYQGDSEFMVEYQDFVKIFWLDNKNRLGDHSKILNIFKKRFTQFDNSNQQDCHEALLLLLDLFDTKLVKDIFYFKFIQETICPSEKSTIYENTNIYMLYPDKNDQTLNNLICANQKWNFLEGFKDNNDITHHVATTQTLIWTPPKILIFSIKMYGTKYKTKIEDTLLINDFIHKDSEYKNIQLTYNLFATCTHIGSSRGGHYIAYTKHKNKWYLKDDTNCLEINTIPLLDFHYIIMYKQG